MQLSKRLLSIGAALLSAIVAPPAFADYDIKWIHASVCTAFHGSEMNRFTFGERVSRNNDTAGNKVITCPILRDNNYVEPYDAGIFIRIDPALGGTVACTLFSINSAGSIVDSTAKMTNVVGNSMFYWIGGDVPSAPGTGGGYLIECSLPPNASVHNLGWTDYLPTDS